ncbi:MAG: hypothetical protein HOV86_31235 [Thermoactinospora sp.]|nr:hypothetical protein [Thermoactinospora sp.]
MTATAQQQQQEAAAPGGRRAARSRRSRKGPAILNALAGLVLASGAIWIQSMAMSPDEMDMPLTYVGDKGEEVDAGRFSVKVEGVDSARTIRLTRDELVRTDLLFLVVNLSATSKKEPLRFQEPYLLTPDGLRFKATDKVGNILTLSNKYVQPGMRSGGSWVFEVPASALQGSSIIVQAPTSALYAEPLIPEVEVDLGIDEALAKQLGSAPKDLYSLEAK